MVIENKTQNAIFDLKEIEITWIENGSENRAVCWIPKDESSNVIWDLINYADMNSDEYGYNESTLRHSALSEMLINLAGKAAMDNREGTTLKDCRKLKFDKHESDCDGWQLDHQHIIDTINDNQIALALSYTSNIMVDGTLCDYCLWSNGGSCVKGD